MSEPVFDVSQLPAQFKERMKKNLGEEFDAFISSYCRPLRGALRVNTLKCADPSVVPGVAEPVPWARDGYYYNADARPGRSPLHEAGAYYIQEASAMAVAAVSGAKEGECVLDLCAAPGGKATALAAMMKNTGLLVANEIMPARAKVLSQNVERMGITNTIVTNETPERLSERFPEFFDRVIVDAPCSGEGMFRKEPEALTCWSLENISLCAERQRSILEQALRMLRPGGTLVYSTCTFAPEEDEEQVQWLEEKGLEVCDTLRLWPHRDEGEGHFAAVLKKAGEAPARDDKSFPFLKKPSRVAAPLLSAWKAFAGESLIFPPAGAFLQFGDNLYLAPAPLSLDGLRVLRPGLQLGELQKDRFIPSHALALALHPDEVTCRIDFDDAQAAAFIAGSELPCGRELSGWCLVCVRGISLGWGKASSGRLKNHYPKGLRRY